MFQATVLGYLLEGWKLATNAKFQHNISQITPARPQKHRYIGHEYNLGVITALNIGPRST